MQPIQPIKGLPAGVEFLGFGVSKKDDYELVGDEIMKGPRPGAASGVLVGPAAGWAFRPARKFDPVTYTYGVLPNRFTPVKLYGQPNAGGAFDVEPKVIVNTVIFRVDNEYDERILGEVMQLLMTLPGFQDLKTE